MTNIVRLKSRDDLGVHYAMVIRWRYSAVFSRLEVP